MNRALLYLVGLQFGGWLRFLRDNLKTVRGALLGAFGALILALWFTAVLFTPNQASVSTGDMARLGPTMLILWCLASVVFSPHDRSIYFTPSEIQFLFPGPFTRREILAYKVFLTLLASLPMSFLLGVALRVRSGWFPAIVLGWFLLMVFVQIFTLVLGLAGTALGASLHTRGRQLVGLLAGLAVAGGIVWLGIATEWDGVEMSQAFFGSAAWQAIASPVQSFFDLMTAQSFGELWLPALIAVATIAVLLVLLFVADLQFEEAAAASSAHLYARILRMQGKRVNVEPLEGQERQRTGGLPMLPFLGGIGPVLWRQLMTAWRLPGRLGLVLVLVCGLVSAPLLGRSATDQGMIVSILSMGFLYLWLLLPVLVPFDFRGDLDRMAILKTLPIPAWRLAIGQVLAPTLAMTAILWLMLLGLLVGQPSHWPLIVSAIAYAPAFCFYLIALDNLAFLLFPVRLQAATPGDFQAVGRNMLLMLGKMMGLVVPGFLVGIGAVLAAFLQAPWLWVVVAAPLTFGIGLALVPAMGAAFDAFDAGRNSPA